MAAAASIPRKLGGGPSSCPSSSSVADYSVLVVVGLLQPTSLLERLLLQIEAGESGKL